MKTPKIISISMFGFNAESYLEYLGDEAKEISGADAEAYRKKLASLLSSEYPGAEVVITDTPDTDLIVVQIDGVERAASEEEWDVVLDRLNELISEDDGIDLNPGGQKPHR